MSRRVEMSELTEIYMDKLGESLLSDGFPDELVFEDESGEVVRYVLDDEGYGSYGGLNFEETDDF